MSKYLLFIPLLFFLHAHIFGQEIVERQREFEFKPYNWEITTLKFQVLDINWEKGLVAVKHIFKLQDIENGFDDSIISPIDCEYSGMNEFPKAGVILGSYDLKEDKYITVFKVLESVTSQSECTPFPKSSNVLQQAKDFFRENDLNVKNHPEGILFTPKNDIEINKFEFTPIGTLDIPSKKLLFECLNKKNIFDKTREDGFQYSEHQTVGELRINGQTVYTRKQKDSFNMASGGKIEFPKLFLNENKCILLERFHHKSGEMGEPDKEIFSFSPIIDLNEIR